MGKLGELVKKLILEGKSDEEVASEALATDLGVEVSAKSVLAEIKAAKALDEVMHGLAEAKRIAAEAQSKIDADADFEKRLDEKFEAKLKTISVNPFQKYGQKITKQWDNAKKDFVSIDDSRFSDSHKIMNDLLLAVATKDNASAHGISKSIDVENERYGIKATMRSDSNAVGGYTIPTEVESTIQQLTYLQSVVLPLAMTDTIIVEGKVYPTIGSVTMTDIATQDTAITETNPTVYNPTIEMKRVGAFSRISNTLLRQKGADLTSAFNTAYASARARYIDTRATIGNITGASQSQDGLVWLGVQESTPVAYADLKTATGQAALLAMLETINQEVDAEKLVFMLNQKLYNQVGQMENSGGFSLFPSFYTGGEFKPFGVKIARNVRMTNALQVSEDNSTGGTDSAIILCDFSKFMIGMEGGIRIRSTMDERSLYDQTTIIGVERMGWDVLYDNTSAPGGICRVLEVTGAGS